jgi:hypothetical protein
MIRKLLFVTSTLVLPYLAYAADPSASLSVQVVPAESGPTAPAGAQAAGYTTLALNSDFTHQLPSNWLGGCAVAGNGAPVGDFYQDDTGHTWWLNIWWSYNYQSCNTVQRADPDFGGLVLDMPWTVDNGYNNIGTVLQSASWDYHGPTQGNYGTANSFPIGSYYEVVARISPSSAAGTYMVLNTWGPDGIVDQNCGCQMEWDVMETDDNNLGLYDSAVHNWGAGGSSWILSPGNWHLDPSQYNTYGLRVTTDGTNAEGCTYINNVFQACAAMPGGIGPKEVNGRNFLVLQNACDYWNQPNGQCNQGQVQHVYVKSVSVWSCANWQTTQCNGTLLTGAP